MIVITNPEKHPWLSAVAYLGAGMGGISIYGLILYDLYVIWGLLGAAVGIAVMLVAAFAAEQLERKNPDSDSHAADIDNS